MEVARIKKLLDNVAAGSLSSEAALEKLKNLPFEDLDFAAVDHHRTLRQGVPEVIFGQGKTPGEIMAIMERLLAEGDNVLVTRLAPGSAAAITDSFPEAVFHERAGCLTLIRRPYKVPGRGRIMVVSAGTSDLPTAEEARITAEFMGHEVDRLYDVGVAGIHRLLSRLDLLRKASVLIVVAGMEGALPSVVGGLVERPVIAVPTSVGYGASFGGVAALLGMLNSCASGVSVVNIDNGFGAAYVAGLINRP
ncbi:MAG: nickel pincer cofactor biosynthesis protein LarB [Pseudomonadota bacterium]